jgi:hypothetical protein
VAPEPLCMPAQTAGKPAASVLGTSTCAIITMAREFGHLLLTIKTPTFYEARLSLTRNIYAL